MFVTGTDIVGRLTISVISTDVLGPIDPCLFPTEPPLLGLLAQQCIPDISD
jgi:hypothetical protein